MAAVLALGFAATRADAQASGQTTLHSLTIAQTPLPANTPFLCEEGSGAYWATYQCPMSAVAAYLYSNPNTFTNFNAFTAGLSTYGNNVVGSSSLSSTAGDVAEYVSTSGAVIQDSGIALSSLATTQNIVVNNAASTINLNSVPVPAALTGAILDVVQADTVVSRFQATAFGAGAAFSGARYDGTNAARTAVQSGDELAAINAWAYNGSALSATAIGSFRIYAAQNIGSGAQGSKGCMATTALSTTSLLDSLCQGPDGGVYVGSATDKGAGTLNAVLYNSGTALAGMATQAPGAIAVTGGTVGGVAITGGSITGGSIDNTPIGGSTPNTGVFTTVTSPTLAGGASAGSTVTVESTSNGSPSGDAVNFKTGGVVGFSIDGFGRLYGENTSAPTCGTGCSDITNANPEATDNRFRANSSSGTSMTVNFAHTWPYSPICTITITGINSISNPYISSTSASLITINWTSTATPSFNVLCL
jgi:hypothetical protein